MALVTVLFPLTTTQGILSQAGDSRWKGQVGKATTEKKPGALRTDRSCPRPIQAKSEGSHPRNSPFRIS